LLSLVVASPAEAQAAAEALRSTGRWIEVVPGMDSVVVRFDSATVDVETAVAAFQEALAEGLPPLEDVDETVEIPVAYGGAAGPDLEGLCQKVGMTEDELIAVHAGGEHRVEMLGFTPGFAFIGGLDERLRVPRRSEPRQFVPPGSVGIAGAYTGIYALGSPGGWTLIGRTTLPLFDADSEQPFALRAGMRVRFRPVKAMAGRS
jgi:inhibitor of KinA